MIIANLNVVSIPVNEPETNTPLVIDRYCVLTLSIACQSVEPIAGWDF